MEQTWLRWACNEENVSVISRLEVILGCVGAGEGEVGREKLVSGVFFFFFFCGRNLAAYHFFVG